MRIDRFVWFARIARTRAVAQGMAGSGHLRIAGRAIDKPAAAVRIGDMLTFAAHGGRIRAIRVLALPARRGPAAEAQGCYEELVIANVSQQSSRD